MPPKTVHIPSSGFPSCKFIAASFDGPFRSNIGYETFFGSGGHFYAIFQSFCSELDWGTNEKMNWKVY